MVLSKSRIYLTKFQENLIHSELFITLFYLIEYIPILHHSILSSFYYSREPMPKGFEKLLKYLGYNDLITDFFNDDVLSYLLIAIIIQMVLFVAYKYFFVTYIQKQFAHLIIITIFEFIFIRTFSFLSIDIEVKAMYSKSTILNFISIFLFFLTFFGTIYHINVEELYLNFHSSKNYCFNNHLIILYDKYHLIIKILICLSRNSDNTKLNSFLELTTLIVHFGVLIASTFLLVQDKNVFFFGSKVLLFNYFKTVFLCINFLSLAFINSFEPAYCYLVLLNGLVISLFFSWGVNYFSFLKIFEKGNELSSVLFMINIGDNLSLKEHIMNKLIINHKTKCENDGKCCLCNEAVLAEEISLFPTIDKKKNVLSRFIKNYFKTEVRSKFLKEKNLTAKDISLYFLIEMYILNYSKNFNYVRAAIEYYKLLKKLELSNNNKDGFGEKIKYKYFLPNFKQNLSLIFYEMRELEFKNEKEQKNMALVKVDFMLTKISSYLKTVKEFFARKINTPKEVIWLSDNLSNLRKQLDLDFLVLKDNSFNYYCLICQYIVERIFNNRTNKAIYLTELIHSYEELLTFKYNEDKIILSSLELKNENFIIKRAGKELVGLNGKAFIKIFPEFLSKEGIKKVIQLLKERNGHNLEFYTLIPSIKTIESIIINFGIIPSLKIEDFSILHILSHYKIHNEKLIVFEKRTTGSVKEEILIGISELASKDLRISPSMIQESLDNGTFIRLDDIINANKIVDFMKLSEKLVFYGLIKKISYPSRKYQLSLKETFYSKYTFFTLIEMSKETIYSSTGYEMTPKGVNKLSTISRELNFQFHHPNGQTSSSCVTNSSTTTHLFRVERIKTERNDRYKKFNLYAFYILGFNFLILIITLVFLVVEMSNNSKLRKTFNVLTNFNNFQGYFYHSSLSVFSLACHSDTVNQTTCSNRFTVMSKRFAMAFNLDDNLLLNQYISRELYVKSKFILSTLTTWMNDKAQIHDKELSRLSTEVFEYYSISQSSNEVKTEINYMTFEEAVKRYVNNINFLSTNEDFLSSPLYVITIDGKSNNDLSNALIGKEPHNGWYFNDSQKYFYTIIMNFQKYIKTNLKLSNLLTDRFGKEISNKNTIILCFFFFFIFSHIVMAIISSSFAIRYKDLHREFYIMIYEKITDIKFIENYLKKLEILSSLTDLFRENPMTMLSKVEKIEHKERVKIVVQKSKRTPEKTKEKPKENNNLNKKVLESMYNTLVVQVFIKKIVGIFSGYIVMCLILYIVINTGIHKMNLMNTYAKDTNTVNIYIYINFCLVQIMSFTNQTDTELFEYFNANSTTKYKSNRFITNNIETVYITSRSLINMQNKYSFFKSLKELIDVDCNTMYKSMNDAIIDETTSATPEINYHKMLSVYCSTFISINQLKDDNLSVDVVTYQNGKLLNEFFERTYERFMDINNSNLLYSVYCEILLILRPIRRFIYKYITNNVIDEIIQSFSIIIIIFIVLNFLFDLAILIFLKKTVINKIVKRAKEIVNLAISLECT